MILNNKLVIFLILFLLILIPSVNAVINSLNYLETSAVFEVWASSKIEVIEEDNVIYAKLLLDNGTPIKNQLIKWVVGDKIFTNVTGDDGVIVFFNELNNTNYVLFYEGNESIFVDSSEYDKKLNDAYLNAIDTYDVDASFGFVGDFVNLSVGVFNPELIDRVEFVLMHLPSGEVLNFNASNFNEVYNLSFQLELEGSYVWKAIYAYHGELLVDYGRPELLIDSFAIIQHSSLNNVVSEFVSDSIVNLTVLVVSDYYDSEARVVRLDVPDEIFTDDVVKKVVFDVHNEVNVSWLLNVTQCGFYNASVNLLDFEDKSISVSINVPCTDFDLNISVEQLSAKVGEPVKWKKTIESSKLKSAIKDDFKLTLPKNSKVDVSKIKNKLTKIYSDDKNDFYNLELLSDDLLEIFYETPAPFSVEESVIEVNPIDGFRKKIKVVGDDNVHYTSIRVSTGFPEELYGFLTLRRLNSSVSSFSEPLVVYDSKDINLNKYNVTFEDLNGNGVPDTISWTVPMLSEDEWDLQANPCTYYVDDIIWSAAAAKGTGTFAFFYDTWDFGYVCPGLEGCYMRNITTYTRMLNVGGSSSSSGDAFQRISNQIEKNCITPSSGTFTTYNAYAPVIAASGSVGPAWTCATGNAGSPNTCSLSESNGYNGTESDWNCTSIQSAAYGNNPGSVILLIDTFQVNYTWCWESVRPVLRNETVYPNPGGWGESFNFSVDVLDPNGDSGDNVTVLAWYKHGIADSWIYGGYAYANDTNLTNSKNINITVTFNESDIDSDVFFFFNGTDSSSSAYTGNTSFSATEDYFEIEKDNLQVDNKTHEFNITINRSQTYNFTTYFYDTDNDTTAYYLTQSPPTAFIAISKYNDNDTLDYVYDFPNSTGYLNREMTNDALTWCKAIFSVGQNYWKSGSSNSQYYKDNITFESLEWGTLPFWLKGNLSNSQMTSPDGNTNYTQYLDSITYTGTINDDCDNTKTDYNSFAVNFSIENGASTYNCTPTSSASCSSTLPLSAPTGWYNVTMTSYSEGSETLNYWNGTYTLENAFYLNAYRKVFGQAVVPDNDFYTVENWNFSVNATSGDSTEMDVKLFLKKGGGSWSECPLITCINQTPIKCTNCENQIVYWYRNFTESDAATWQFMIKMVNNVTGLVENETNGLDSFEVKVSSYKIPLENASINVSTGEWGSTTFKFNVTVNTTGVNNVTVYLWDSNDSSGPWTLIGEDNYTIDDGNWQTLNFTKEYNCTGVDDSRYFFFNATDMNGTTNSTSTQGFAVEKNTVLMNYIAGQGEIANRTGSQTRLLSFYVRDINGTDLSSFPIKYSITTTNNTDNYYTDSNFIILTSAGGYANLSFNATCQDDYSGAPEFQVGEQQWKAEVNASELSCYKQNDTSTFLSRNLFVRGDLNGVIDLPDGSENYTYPQSILLQGYIDNDCGSAMSISVNNITYNVSTSNYYTTCSNVEMVGANVYKCTWSPTQEASPGYYNVTFKSNDSYYWENITLVDEIFYYFTKPKLVDARVDLDVEAWTLSRLFEVNVSDNLG
ncbi:MAG: hypothetical protein GON13_03795, partial [Nanoarchaeota archaeon]|nr:hypothetical protein [Nanoarchaeota archaeon]